MYHRYRSRTRIVKDWLKRGLRWIFEVGQRCGLDILPRHFYSSIPDIRSLRREQTWKSPHSMVAVQGAELEQQLQFAGQCCAEHLIAIQEQRDLYAESVALSGELGFGPADAEFLFCFVASQRPGRIVQVGCGVSTAVIQLAAAHAGYTPDLTCIEPYPSDFLKAEQQAGRLHLQATKAEIVALETLTALGDGDLLFVDSTHTLRPGGEVPRIILEVLPRLKSGCFAHFHDIWFPYNHSPHILTSDLFFWQESYLLHAFLADNSRFRLCASLSMLYHNRFAELKRLLPNLHQVQHPHGELTAAERYPVSAYLRVV